MTQMANGMTIGRLAKEAGVNVETIRYYHRRGLLDEPRKPLGGQRRYPQSALDRMSFIRRAQQLGFTLAEIQELLAYSDGRNWRTTRDLAQRKYATLGLHVAQLNRMRRALKRLIAKSLAGRGRGCCPIIESLAMRD
jgi:MerR family mercuric resistance operon transcriptional regulator